MNCTKANVIRKLTDAGYELSTDGQTGRKFLVGGRSRTIGTSSEGIAVTVMNLTYETRVYVTYRFSTFSYPTPRDYDHCALLMAGAYGMLDSHFDRQFDKRSNSVYFTTKSR